MFKTKKNNCLEQDGNQLVPKLIIFIIVFLSKTNLSQCYKLYDTSENHMYVYVSTFMNASEVKTQLRLTTEYKLY